MARAILAKELCFEVKNETGVLGQITATLAMQGIYIVHLLAYSVKEKGFFQIITRENEKAAKILKELAPRIRERNVLVVEFENKVGTLAPVTRLLGSNGIGVESVYGTSGDGFKITGIFSTDDNKRAAEVINRDSGHLAVHHPTESSKKPKTKKG